MKVPFGVPLDGHGERLLLGACSRSAIEHYAQRVDELALELLRGVGRVHVIAQGDSENTELAHPGGQGVRHETGTDVAEPRYVGLGEDEPPVAASQDANELASEDSSVVGNAAHNLHTQ
jgi:hypothetical protein